MSIYGLNQRRWVARTISVALWRRRAARYSPLQATLEVLVVDDGPKIVHRARVVGVPQRADGEVCLRGDQTHDEDQKAEGTTRRC